MDVLARAPDVEAPVAVSGAPAHPRRAGIAAMWFLLREIELAAVRVRAVRLDKAARTVTLRLPQSKTDPKAEGKERTHGCCCNEQGGRAICPYHVIADQVAYCEALVGDRREAQDQPLFPKVGGGACSKQGWAKAMRLLTARHETPQECAARGSHALTGHCARRGGAQFLARFLLFFVVQIYGRWGSDAIRRYVEDSPLEYAASFASKAVARWSKGRAKVELEAAGANGAVGKAVLRLPKAAQRSVWVALRESDSSESSGSD